MQKKDHIFICAGNSSSRATSRSLRSRGSFLGSLLFPTAPPSAKDLFSHLSLFRQDVSPEVSEWCRAPQPRLYYFHFHLPNLPKFPGQVWDFLDLGLLGGWRHGAFVQENLVPVKIYFLARCLSVNRRALGRRRWRELIVQGEGQDHLRLTLYRLCGGQRGGALDS